MGQKTELVWLAGHLWPSSRSLGTSYLFQRPEILQRSFGTVFKCGKLLLCVFLGTVVRGADTPPHEMVPCSFAWRQLCPALAGCSFPPSLV